VAEYNSRTRQTTKFVENYEQYFKGLTKNIIFINILKILFNLVTLTLIYHKIRVVIINIYIYK